MDNVGLLYSHEPSSCLARDIKGFSSTAPVTKGWGDWRGIWAYLIAATALPP